MLPENSAITLAVPPHRGSRVDALPLTGYRCLKPEWPMSTTRPDRPGFWCNLVSVAGVSVVSAVTSCHLSEQGLECNLVDLQGLRKRPCSRRQARGHWFEPSIAHHFHSLCRRRSQYFGHSATPGGCGLEALICSQSDCSNHDRDPKPATSRAKVPAAQVHQPGLHLRPRRTLQTWLQRPLFMYWAPGRSAECNESAGALELPRTTLLGFFLGTGRR